MDIGFSEEQELLRDTARKFLESECDDQVRARMMATEPPSPTNSGRSSPSRAGSASSIPKRTAAAGLGLRRSRRADGGDGPRGDARARTSRRCCSAAPRSPRRARAAQRREWLPRIAAGEAKAALAWTEPNARWDAAGDHRCRRARPGGGFTLSGTKLFVPDAHLADAIVVAARTRDGSTMEDGVSLFLVPKDTAGLAVKLLPTMDETRKNLRGEARQRRGAGDGAARRAARAGRRWRGWSTGRPWRCRAEMCGGAQQVLDMTVEYAKIRIAFGKPIGSYQGVKHQAADMLVDDRERQVADLLRRLGGRRGRRRGAAGGVDGQGLRLRRRTARSRGAGIQLHGGIGMTWEHDLHLYFKRAKASEVAFGDATWHRERIAGLLGG